MVQSSAHADSSDLSASHRRIRSQSISDAQFTKAGMLSPPPVEPEPAFIASSAAAQIVTADLEQSEYTTDDDQPLPELSDGAVVSQSALSNLNSFLDHLLFNILASAKSTQLSALRPAIADVLKPRLAKEVVDAADEELSEYMGGGTDDDELQEFRGGQTPRGEFDLTRSWKLTRLRCMVYTRLGDMEEDDEDEYIEREGLDDIDGAPRRFTSHIGNITPAAAIFLTSIIEYIGEQALIIAGENARTRVLSAQYVAGREEGGTPVLTANNTALVIEDSDMEKLALNGTLGRLWRTWRKRVKSPSLTRAVSRESFARRGLSIARKNSTGKAGDIHRSDSSHSLVETSTDSIGAATTGLGLYGPDGEEVQVVDAASRSSKAFDSYKRTNVAPRPRPRSLLINNTGGLITPVSSNAGSPNPDGRTGRSRSQPPPSVNTPVAEDDVPDEEYDTPPEERPPLETMYEHEHEHENDPETDTSPVPPEQDLSSGEIDRETTPIAARDSYEEEDEGREEVGEVEDHYEGTAIYHGQGTYQRPKITMQRPRRKSSKEASSGENHVPIMVNPIFPPPAQVGLPTQGGDIIQASDTSVSPQPATHSSHVREQPDGNALRKSRKGMIGETPLPKRIDSRESYQTSSSRYSDSVGAPISASDEGENVSYSRDPSKTTPDVALTSTSVRYSPGDHPNVERAAVQRVFIPNQPSAVLGVRSQRSDSINSGREKRPPTAGSATSTVSHKLKGLIARTPVEAEYPFVPPRLRSGSETSHRSSRSDGVDDAKSDLDRLINSNTTLHYTLTPRSMREMELPGSPRWATHEVYENGTFLKDSSPVDINQEREALTSPNRLNGLRAHPIADTPSSTIELPPMSPASTKSNRSKIAGQARDARTGGDSVRDIADFLRSTGPPGSASQPSASPTASLNGSLRTQYRNASGSVVKSSSKPMVDHSPKKFQDPDPSVGGGLRLQTPSTEDDRGRYERNQNSPPNPSIYSFRTTLVDPTQRPAQRQGSLPVITDSGDHPLPARKQRRVRDPYAIDTDDEDDTEEPSNGPKPTTQKEESLLDFLKNAPPPPASHQLPQPFLLTTGTVTGSPAKSPGGLSAATVLKSRLKKSISSLDQPGSPVSVASGSSHFPPDSKPVYGGSINSNSNTRIDTVARNQGYIPRTNRNLQPKSPAISVGAPRSVQRQTETSALAEFLRNTGPPEPPSRRPSTAFSEERSVKDSSTLSRFFSRRKKLET